MKTKTVQCFTLFVAITLTFFFLHWLVSNEYTKTNSLIQKCLQNCLLYIVVRLKFNIQHYPAQYKFVDDFYSKLFIIVITLKTHRISNTRLRDDEDRQLK